MRDYFLRSARLGFGVWTSDDLDLALGLWGDPRVTRLIGGPFTEAQVEERLSREIRTQEDRGLQYWPLFRLDDGMHVGCCGMRPWREPRVLELGFHLRRDHWGHGYATEAARTVMAHALTLDDVDALVAGHHPENRDSRRLLGRLGFRYTADERYAPTGLEHSTYRIDRTELRARVVRRADETA